MKLVFRSLRSLARDDRGGATIEYALVAALIIVGSIALIAAFGSRALARWNAVDVPGL